MKNSLRLNHLDNSYPKEAFLFQIFQHLSTDFFAFAEAFIIHLIKNESGQMWESFTQFLHRNNLTKVGNEKKNFQIQITFKKKRGDENL